MLKNKVFLLGFLLSLFTLLNMTNCDGPVPFVPYPSVDEFAPERGGEGTTVTIEGRFFGDRPQVYFGNTKATMVNYLGENKVKVQVPVGATTSLIRIKSKQGFGSSQKNFIVPNQKKWTLLVYLDGDNNLESAAIDDFLEMSSVGSSDEVNVLVQMDRSPLSDPKIGYTNTYGNWTDTRRFLIGKDDEPDMNPLDNLGEVNMGHPDTLESFVTWAITNYPAEHYGLILWNHGGGWRIMQQKWLAKKEAALKSGNDSFQGWKAVCIDESQGDDALHTAELKTALLGAQYETQVKIDLLGFDACLMAMAEVAYQIRNHANYMVGSENFEPGDGWPYDAILKKLVDKPNQDVPDLAKLIVDEYGRSFSGDRSVTQSALDLSKMQDFASVLDSLSQELDQEWSAFQSARQETDEFHSLFYPIGFWGVDVWDFADETLERSDIIFNRSAAARMKEIVEEVVIANYCGTDFKDSKGIAIYFPPSLADFNNDPDATGYTDANTVHKIDLVRKTRWDNWLQEFYSHQVTP